MCKYIMKHKINKYVDNSLLHMPLVFYPIGFIDFCYVIVIYICASLVLAAIINGLILPPFIEEESAKKSSVFLVGYLSMIFALQGFLTVLMCAILELIPSPINGIFGYSINSPIGIIVRNPAIVTIILFGLSKTLTGIIKIICDRFQEQVITYTQYRLGKQKKPENGTDDKINAEHDKAVKTV